MARKLFTGARKLFRRAKNSYTKVNAYRKQFKKQHPLVYRYGKKAAIYGAESAFGPSTFALGRGAYNAYRGRNKGVMYQGRNAIRTAYKYQSAKGFEQL